MSTGTTKRLFVGNVPFRIEAEELRALFEEVAPLVDFFWPIDRETGRKKGFLFVDADEADMDKIIEAMNGREVMGRQLVVNEARPREEGRGGGKASSKAIALPIGIWLSMIF